MGTSPGWTYGQVPTAGQWNNEFASKQDDLGYVPVNRSGDTMEGPLVTAPSKADGANLIVSEGVAPTLPANGDLWMTTSGLYYMAGNNVVGPLNNGITAWKQAANYATTAPLPACAYDNGTLGVGATLTADTDGALTVDGGAVTDGQRVLVKNQATSADNGVYVVTQAGSAGNPWILTRAEDYDQFSNAQAGDSLNVLAGDANANTFWVQVTVVAVMGTDPIAFSQFAPAYQAGTGLLLDGASFAIDTSVTADLTSEQTLENKTLIDPDLGTPAAINLPNATGLDTVGSDAGVLPGANGGTPICADRTALAGVSTSKNTTAWLAETGREGWFEWSGDDLSAQVTVDSEQGIYLAPLSDPTGASGAWVRQYVTATAEMFGALGDGTTDDSTAINAALAVATVVQLFPKTYAVAHIITVTGNGMFLFSAGSAGATFTGTTPATGACLLWTGVAGGQVVHAGSFVNGVDMLGGGLGGLQINGGGTASAGIVVQAIQHGTFRDLDIMNVRSTSSDLGLLLWTQSTLSGNINCVYQCTFTNIAVSVSGSAKGIVNATPGSPAHGGMTFCTWTNIIVTYYNGAAIYLSRGDDNTFTTIGTARISGGTGAALQMQGGTIGGDTDWYCNTISMFNCSVQSGSPSIIADGASCRQNYILLSGVDYHAIPTITNGAELYFDYLGGGYSGTLAGEQPYYRVPPLQITNYENTDLTTLDWYQENPTALVSLSFGAATTGITYGTRICDYTRIGNRVLATIEIVLTSKGTATGTAALTLPIKSASSAATAGSLYLALMTSGVGDTAVGCSLAGGSTTLIMSKTVSGTETALTDADFTDTSIIYVSIAYRVA